MTSKMEDGLLDHAHQDSHDSLLTGSTDEGSRKDFAPRGSSLDRGPWWCTRRCQLTAGLTLVILAILAVIAITVIVPDIVQDSVNDATFEVGDMNMTNPHQSSVALTTEATITLDATQPMDCKLEGGKLNFDFKDPTLGWVKVGNLDMPSVTIDANTKKTSILLDSVLLEITEQSMWRRFSQAIVLEESVTWRIRGNVKVRVTVLGDWQLFVPKVHLKKEINQIGMDGLPGATVSTFDAETTTEEHYPSMVASLYVYNPSPVAIMPLGVLTTKVTWQGVTMGWAKTTHNITMHRGMNLIHFKGPLAPDNTTMLSTLMSRFLGGKKSDVKITITNFTDDGSDPAWPDWEHDNPACTTPIYSTALNNVDIPFVLSYPGGRVNLTTESITDTDPKYLKVFVTSYLPLWVGVFNPFTASERVVQIKMDIIHDGVTFATVNEPNVSIPLKPNANTLSGTDLASSVTLIVPPSDTALAVVQELDAGRGYTYVGSKGTFTLQVGNLQLDLQAEQSQNIPSCALTQYAQVTPHGGVCNRPNSSIIVAT